MSELTDKLKNSISIKVVIYAVVGIGLAIYLIYHFSGSDTTKQSSESGIVLIKDEKPKTRDFFENNEEKKKLASTGILDETLIPTTQNYSDITDDPDMDIINQTQEKIRNSNLQNQQKTSVSPTPVVSAKPSVPAPVQAAPVQVQVTEQKTLPEVVPEVEADPEPEQKKNRFFEGKRRERRGNTLSCVVHGEQEVMNGSTIKLRLMEEYTTDNGIKIEKGTTLWGVCNLSKERMNVTIQSVLNGKDLIPLNFVVFDIDGLQGINLPNNVKAEIAKRAKAQSLQDAPTDEIIGNGGILEKGARTVVNTTKNILSKKQEEIKITVKSNYRLVLKNTAK